LGGPAIGANPSAAPYTCTGGAIPSGNYASVTVTGQCGVEEGAVISVVGNVNVAAGAGLDAQVSSTITVGHNVTAAAGSFLFLGCQPPYSDRDFGHPCEDSSSSTGAVTVDGNVSATDANTVLLNGITVIGQVTLTGGGGDIPWAEKNNTIGGNFTVTGVTADWFGALFNTVDRNVSLTDITATDPGDLTPTISVAGNNVAWNLNCSGIGPNLSIGLLTGLPNVVGRQANGQCASPLI
jgi:hypothetical protein